MSVRLFIGNLPYAASEPELREHLSSVGEPTQIVLPVDRETGRPRGFAFVDYADRAVAEAAISRFDQQPFKGRPLAVSEARPREERPAGAPRPGGYGGPPRPGAAGGSSGGFAPRPSGWAPRPSDSGSGAPSGPRSRNFGPDAPPRTSVRPPARMAIAVRKARSRNGRSAVCTRTTKTGATRSRTRTSTTSPRARRRTPISTAPTRSRSRS